MVNRYAFFDVDGTIVSIKTMFSFQEFWSRHQGVTGQIEHSQFLQTMGELADNGASREDLNRAYYRFFAGRSVRKIEELAVRWYKIVSEDPGFFHSSIIDELHKHRVDGTTVVFVSGSFRQVLKPLADQLDVAHILCASPIEAEGVFTGELGSPQTIGGGKATAVNAFLSLNSCESGNCWAYGDDISDLPMLSAVGHPIVVAGDPRLEAHARRHGWNVMPP